MPQTLLMESMHLPDFLNYSQNIASGKKKGQETTSHLGRIDTCLLNET